MKHYLVRVERIDIAAAPGSDTLGKLSILLRRTGPDADDTDAVKAEAIAAVQKTYPNSVLNATVFPLTEDQYVTQKAMLSSQAVVARNAAIDAAKAKRAELKKNF